MGSHSQEAVLHGLQRELFPQILQELLRRVLSQVTVFQEWTVPVWKPHGVPGAARSRSTQEPALP